MSAIIFFIYIFFFSPLIKIYFLTEEQSHKLEYFDITTKLYYYTISQLIEIIFRLLFNYFRKKKTLNIFLFFARNELYKIKKDFTIEIDYNFNLTININNNNKNNIYNKEFEENEDNNFFQYVICYPNVRYYDWDTNILNEKEKVISNLIKKNIENIEDHFLLRYGFSAIIIFCLYILSFYCLTKANVKMFFIWSFILFFFTKIISIILSLEMKKSIVSNEELVNKFYISKGYGYIVSFSTCMIEIFKLNSKYGSNDININEVYNILSKKVNHLNNKFYIFKK